MIPLKLDAQNLMAYRHLNLDFSRFKIACLSGQNGAGKSTILDAITWVLWEKARASSEELIRIGEQEVRVEFDFKLENQEYRVIRSRKRRKSGKSSGKSSLEFQLKTENGFRSLSGKSTRHTQQEINQILHMDYNLFINSSFILQGRADEFTMASPSDRKKILSDILNLALYDRLQEQARELKNSQQKEQSHLQGRIQQLQEKADQYDNLQQELTEAEKSHQEMTIHLQAQEKQFHQLEKEYTQINQNRIRLEHVEKQYEQYYQQYQLDNQENQTLEEKLANLRSLLERQGEIEAGYQEWQQLQQQKSELEEQYERFNQLQSQQTELQRQITDCRHELALAQKECEQDLKQLYREKAACSMIFSERGKIMGSYEKWQAAIREEAQYQECYQQYQSLEREKNTLDKQLQEAIQRENIEKGKLEALIQEREHKLGQATHIEGKFEQLKRQLQTLEQKQLQLNQIQDEGIELRNQSETLQQKCQDFNEEQESIREKIKQLEEEREAECPLCSQKLAKQELQKLIQRYRQTHAALEQEWTDKNLEIGELTGKLEVLRKQYIQLQTELKQWDNLQKEYGQLEKQVQEKQTLQEEISQFSQQVSHIIDKIEQGKVLPETSQRLNIINQQLQELAFDHNEYTLVQAKVKDWQWVEGKYKELQTAEETMQALETRISTSEKKRHALVNQIETSAYAQQERQELAFISQELETMGNVQRSMRVIREKQQEKQPYIESWQALQQALLQKKHLSEQLEKNQIRQRRREEELANLSRKLEARERILEQYQQLENQRQVLREKLSQYQQLEKELHARCFALKKECSAIENTQEILRLAKEEVAAFTHEIRLYHELTDIMGRNGIQAVIIENAIPEIEHVANELLTRMTDGRMHVKFQTLKALKTKDTMDETLEIMIADELGTRNYETYSAGEAFRVNFSIRLAISKFLARRAGAKLQTLVIDEGFGTQDSHGKARIVEAINSVANDFDTIIIITHIQELKEMFPYRIEVIKQNTGSILKMSD